MTEEPYSMKDDFFNDITARLVTDNIMKVWPEFDEEGCYQKIVGGFQGLELKARMSHIRHCLEEFLTDDYPTNLDIMAKALDLVDQGHFVFGAFCEYIEYHGCNDAYIGLSLQTLGIFTKKFSGEFAIRRFINEYPEQAYQAMMTWSTSDDTDQCRLASEGLRPKLPWASGIQFDYLKGIEPLENLYKHKERYVTRSVSNHLNDVSKINPEVVINTLERWSGDSGQDPKEMAYIISHSTRTLVKRSYQPALALLGYTFNPDILIKDFKVMTPEIVVGEALQFSCRIECQQDVHLIIDYCVDYPMANGKRSTKVFKLKKVKGMQGQIIEIAKKHPFRIMTTKKLYSGVYNITLQINGRPYDSGVFSLTL